MTANTGRLLRDSTRVAEQLDLASSELLQLLPRLGDALEKDVVPDNSSKVATSRTLTSPVNPVVLDTAVSLRAEIPTADAKARARLGETQRSADLDTCVAAVKALYLRLVDIDLGHARRYANDAFRWQRLARRAIGLSRPGRPLGHDCPAHDDPRTPLVVLGDEGTLHAVPAGKREAISWRRTESIWCPRCGSRWGRAEYGVLGRMVADRDERLAETRTEAS